MNFDVLVNGRPWNVAIEPGEESGQFTAIVKSRKRLVDAFWIDKDTISLIVDSAAREVRIDRRAGGPLALAIGGKVFEAVVAHQKRDRDPLSDASGVVRTPMPGRVVRVLAAVGDRVAAHQGVVIIEAMKMENELRAPRDGWVKEVTVVAGAAVEAGTVLVVIE